MYLVRGKQAMIIGGGMSWMAPLLEGQLKESGVDFGDIKYLVIQHPHFDHCGAVPYLKRMLPQIKVLAVEEARKVLSKPKVIDYIEMVNLHAIDKYGLRQEHERLNLTIDGIDVDEVVDNSTSIGLGNSFDVNFIETPGHTADSVSVYIAKLKAIFPSDSAPCPLGKNVEKLMMPSAQYDFTLYKESLRKLITYDVEICAFEHTAAAIGPDARQILLNGLRLTEEYEKLVVSLYLETKDVEQVATQIAGEANLKLEDFDFMDASIMMPVARAYVRNVLKSAGIIAE
jgi:2-aminobenzoylacetyl-CoA thioesterase